MYSKLLKNKDFLKVYCANCISSFGDGLDDIAFALLLYSISNSTFVTSYVFAIKIVFSFFSIFTGTLADRINKKSLIFFGEISQAVTLILLLLINKFFSVNTSILVIFATMQAIFSTISVPAKNSLCLLVMDKKALLESRALLNTSLQIIQVFSYTLSAVFINILGTYMMLFIDSITFIISGLLFISVTYTEVNIPYKKISEFKQDVLDGILFIKNRTGIILILLMAFIGNILMAPSVTLLPAYFETYYSKGNEYSLFMCLLSIGGILSTLILPKLCKIISEINMLIIGFAFGGIGLFFLLKIDNNMYYFIAASLIGISISLVSVLNANILQRFTPNNMLGRVFSIFKFMSCISAPIGMMFIGIIGDYISILYIFFTCGLLMTIFSIIGYFFFRINNVNENKLNEVI